METAVHTDLPIHILAPYIAAAAQAVLQGDAAPFDQRAVEAIDEAEQKLESQRATVANDNELGNSIAALAPRTSGTAFELAALVLGALAPEETLLGQPGAPRDQRDQGAPSSRGLGEVIELLGLTRTGDKAAAEVIATLFDKVVDRVFGRQVWADI